VLFVGSNKSLFSLFGTIQPSLPLPTITFFFASTTLILFSQLYFFTILYFLFFFFQTTHSLHSFPPAAAIHCPPSARFELASLI
jgi:hypothetical protein